MGQRTRLVLRRPAAALLTAVLAAFVVTATAGSAAAGPDEGSFASAVNAARTSQGIAPLAVMADLSAVARAQAQRCADANQLFHNPNLGGDVTGWQVVAENVGVGGDWRSIQDAFMASPEHRANLMDPIFTQMGVGTAVSRDGSLWVSQVFREPAGAPSGASSSAATSAPVSSGTAPSTGTPSTWSPAPPSPEQVLRGKLAQARSQLNHTRHDDPLRSAEVFATVMSTVGR
ncbi:MAG: CAP domain-containing protein [Actinomycetes bacterium]